MGKLRLSQILGIGLVVVALLMLLTQPLASIGQRMGPGWADVLGGGVPSVLLLVGATIWIIGLLRNRPRP